MGVLPCNEESVLGFTAFSTGTPEALAVKYVKKGLLVSEEGRGQGHVLFTVPQRPGEEWTTLWLLKDTNKSSVRAWLLGVVVQSLGRRNSVDLFLGAGHSITYFRVNGKDHRVCGVVF